MVDTVFQASASHIIIVGCSIFGIFWGVVNVLMIRRVKVEEEHILTALKHAGIQNKSEQEVSINEAGQEVGSLTPSQQILQDLLFINEKITEGAISFLTQEYLYLSIFSAIFAFIIGGTVDANEMGAESYPTNFPYTATSYLVGSATSILAGFIGMRIAVYTNTRTTYKCCESANEGFFVAFRGGQVLGFTLVGLALLILHIIIVTFKATWFDGALTELQATPACTEATKDEAKCRTETINLVRRLFELVAGYGLGGSSVALFGRVGGGIYTKAADVGADLVGKTVHDLAEDDKENPGTIADNVGDNVGDIAGMGADLFGSLAESTCAALVVSSTSYELIKTPESLLFPLCVTAAGIVASFVSVLCAHFGTVTKENVQQRLKWQIGISTILMTACVVPVIYLLPATFNLGEGAGALTGITRWQAYICIICGLWSGMVIGFVTEYYTSNAYGPTLNLVDSCKMGPAPNIIQGLALGYLSCIVPILCIAATIGYAFTYCGMYGIALAALGMLGSLPVALTIDGYGPISDNAGGVAEMSGLPPHIRELTDALDAAGNTTAAVGKGFAIGSACLVGLALFGAFITRTQAESSSEKMSVDILKPVPFCGLLIGAMLPYAFSAMTMKAVGDAAFAMMYHIIKDYKHGQEEKAEGRPYNPDYEGCIKISTDASLRMMIAPGALVLGSPLLAGFTFGPDATAGLLAGAIVSGVQVAISASNTGGAWDNCKKEIEKQRAQAQKDFKEYDTHEADIKARYADIINPDTEKVFGADAITKSWVQTHAEVTMKERKVAAVVGDTVGDPLKDTSGPAINILIKLSAITSLVFGSYIKKYNLAKAFAAPAAAAPTAPADPPAM